MDPLIRRSGRPRCRGSASRLHAEAPQRRRSCGDRRPFDQRRIGRHRIVSRRVFLGRCCPPRLHGGPRYRRALPRAGRRATTRRRKTHRLRIAISNGLSQDVWREFLDRFGPLRVPEFCASTEGNVWLYDLQGKIRSIGGIPPYLTSREYGDIRVKLYCI
jgi:hypothetical protein